MSSQSNDVLAAACQRHLQKGLSGELLLYFLSMPWFVIHEHWQWYKGLDHCTQWIFLLFLAYTRLVDRHRSDGVDCAFEHQHVVCCMSFSQAQLFSTLLSLPFPKQLQRSKAEYFALVCQTAFHTVIFLLSSVLETCMISGKCRALLSNLCSQADLCECAFPMVSKTI